MTNSWKPPIVDRQIGKTPLPSWIVSLSVHGVLLMAFAAGINSCDSGYSGAAEEDFRSVGIFTKATEDDSENAPETNDATSSTSDAATDANEKPPTEADLAKVAANSLNQLAQNRLDLPTLDNLGVIGAGAPLQLPDSGPEGDVVQGLKGAPPPGAAISAARGTTAFFDIKAKGTRFVYIVDHSGSMGANGQLQIAKSEILTSLASLDANQQFQVIFYNTFYRQFKQPNKPAGMVWGTDINKTLAGQYIRSISPDGGTDHMPALKKALGYRPEHIFFLTDADVPRLSAKDLDQLKSISRGRTQIHCIEFGKGAQLNSDNFLKKLARQNGGTYHYRDVKNFGKR
jgi:Ca-activated chloride channel family protein